MVKSLLKQSSLLLLALLLGGSLTASAATKTVTLTAADLDLGSSYKSSSVTIDEIKYAFTDLMKNSTNIQAKASSGVIQNSTAYPGMITQVKITHSGTARATTISGSEDGVDWTQVATGSGSLTADFTSKSFTYFKITRGANAAYWTQIEITYETSLDNRTPVATIGDLTPTEIVNGDDDYFDCPITYADGATGTVKYGSSDDDILMVATDGEYLAQATGSVKVTVTVTPNDATTFKEVSKEFTVTVTKAPHVAAFNEVFYEDFDQCDGAGGNDGQWSGSLASGTLAPGKGLVEDGGAWDFENGYAAKECVRLGTGSKKGSASFKLFLNPGTYELNFKAAAWNTNSENTTIEVLDNDQSELYVIDSNNNMEQYAQLTKGAFADYYCYVTVVEAGEQTITFQAITASNNRFFLDEVQLLAIDQTKDVTSHGWATYITQYGSTFDPGTAYAVTAVGADQQTITISEVTEAKAGTPLLLKGAGQTITATVADTDVEPSNMLIVYNGSISGYPYVLAQDGDGAGFKQWTGDESKLNGRVVLPLDFAQPSNARLMRIVEGGATGISTVETVVMGGNSCFDLQGRRVAQPRKGLYIVDGKKMVIK